jgi:signal transduction histidine kinase
VALSVAGGLCRLQVTDNGRGFDHEQASDGGLGLVNMRRRAEKLHGKLTVESIETGGTRIEWEVPTDHW